MQNQSLSDKELVERYKMALEAMLQCNSGSTFDNWVNMKNIANIALKGK